MRRLGLGLVFVLVTSGCRGENPAFDEPDGDGEPPGDGDGEPPGDGDGDGEPPGDGDGDGEPPGEGDGDGEPPGDGDGDGCPLGETLCDGDCVDLSSNPQHCTACGNSCAASQECIDGCVPAADRIVFVSSMTIEVPDLGSAAAADEHCTLLAAEAGLEGEFRAWVGDAQTSPATGFGKAGGKWVLLDQKLVATSWTDLTDGTLHNPINVNEHGQAASTSVLCGEPPTVLTYTGVEFDGTTAELNCDEWSNSSATTFVGDAGQLGDGNWTRSPCELECNVKLPIYCFEQ